MLSFLRKTFALTISAALHSLTQQQGPQEKQESLTGAEQLTPGAVQRTIRSEVSRIAAQKVSAIPSLLEPRQALVEKTGCDRVSEDEIMVN